MNELVTKVCRERCSIKILPTDGDGRCKPICLDRRQVGLEREGGKFLTLLLFICQNSHYYDFQIDKGFR